MSEPKFRYEIHPRIPMRNVLDKAIIKPTTVELTIDQVRECLKYGPVYRRFNADHIEKVTMATIEDLHRAKFEVPAKKAETPVVEPKKVVIRSKEEPKPVVVEEKVEEPAPVVEETPVEEAPVVEEKVEEVVPEASVVEEPKVEEVREEAPVIEEPVEEKVDNAKEEVVPEAPVEEPVEEEKPVESSEEENVAEVTEEDEDDVEAPKSGNVGKKRKHH